MSGDAARPTLGSTERQPPWVSPEVASVGAASFFSDAGHEIATAVLPSFLTGVLRGSAATLGLGPITGHIYGIALLLKATLEQHRQPGLILHHQHPHAPSMPSQRCQPHVN